MHVWNNKRQNVYLVWPLRLAQVLLDGSVFLIMGMSMPAILRAQCYAMRFIHHKLMVHNTEMVNVCMIP